MALPRGGLRSLRFGGCMRWMLMMHIPRAHVPKEAVFTMKLKPAPRADLPASQVMRELMRSYIEQRRLAREYDEYLRCKVEAAPRCVPTGYR